MSRLRWTVLVATYALVGVACGPGADVDASSAQYLIYNYDTTTGDYGLETVRIETLRDVRSVDGDIVYLRGGGSLVSSEETPRTEAEWEKALVVDGSGTPTVEFTVDEDGTIVPWDFDSAMMLTVYHHMERAADFFDGIDTSGLELPDPSISKTVGRIPVYYYPQISLFGFPLPLFTDNAAYAFTMNAFLVPPRASITDAVPIYANRGVITHEYSHAVFNRLVYDNARAPSPILDSDEWPAIASNEINGLDEGIADIYAFLDLKDPNFIKPSISFDIGRDMSVPKQYSPELLAVASLEEGDDPITDDAGNPIEYDSHILGAIVAAIFYELRQKMTFSVSDEDFARAVTQSLRDIRNPGPTFRITQFFDALHDNLPAAQRPIACRLFKERLPAVQDLLQCQS